MNSTQLCERYVLPAVMSFALGVLAMDMAVEAREQRANELAASATDLADRAINVVEIYRANCGEVFEAGRPLVATLTEDREQ